MISVRNEQTAIPIDVADLEAKAHKLMSLLGYENFELGILLTDLETIEEYNSTYRHKDKPTDILSFPYHENIRAGEKIIPICEDDKNLGDIILCPEYIKQDLPQWDQTFEERMDVLLVHGILHLLGYDHIEDEDYEIMRAEEKRLLEHLRLPYRQLI